MRVGIRCPSRTQLEAAARRWGIRDGDTVVAYDDVHSVAAARAWWVLTRSGLADVRVLDGGLRGWLAERLPLETGDVLPRPPGDVVLGEITDGIADIDGVEEWPDHGLLLDVRAPERYRGDAEPLDPVAGHIPGAVNLPTTVHLTAGRFRTPDEIRAEFAAAGVADGVAVAAYCGSGIAATHTALAGALAGIDVVGLPGLVEPVVALARASRRRRPGAVAGRGAGMTGAGTACPRRAATSPTTS